MSFSPFDDFLFSYRPAHRHTHHPHSLWAWPWGVSQRRRPQEEDEFDQLVRAVDGRFGGILSHLQHPQEVEVEEDKGAGEQGESSKSKNYHMKIAVQDFAPDNIKVKVQGNNLIVEAKKEEKKEQEGMYAHSYCEFKRSFPLPEGVDKKKLQSHLTSSGVLEIDAPIVAAIEAPKPPEKQKIDVEHMEEE